MPPLATRELLLPRTVIGLVAAQMKQTSELVEVVPREPDMSPACPERPREPLISGYAQLMLKLAASLVEVATVDGDAP
jgi:glycine cleavage system protein P-like pyridoxal-binding family